MKEKKSAFLRLMQPAPSHRCGCVSVNRMCEGIVLKVFMCKKRTRFTIYTHIWHTLPTNHCLLSISKVESRREMIHADNVSRRGTFFVSFQRKRKKITMPQHVPASGLVQSFTDNVLLVLHRLKF